MDSDTRFNARLFYPHLDEGDAGTVIYLKRLLGTGAAVRCKCFSREEVKVVSSQLTPEERAKVRFSWREFGGLRQAVNLEWLSP